MQSTPLRCRLSHRLRAAALAALALLALLATLLPTPTVGANETAPTPPTWHYVRSWEGAVGLFERYDSRFYVGREYNPTPRVDNGKVVNRPGPPDNSAPIGSPGDQWVNHAGIDVLQGPGERLQCPWPWERSQRGFFTYWAPGHWTKFATWSSTTNHATGETVWTKGDEFWTFIPASSACNDDQYITPTPTRRPTDPTPTPLPETLNLPTPTPYPTSMSNLACVSVPYPLRLTLRVSRNNGTTWTDYAFRDLAWRTDYTMDEYWNAQGGQLTLDDLPPSSTSDWTMRFPHKRTWLRSPSVQAGDLVEAVFHIERMDILRGPDLRGAYAAFDGNLSGQWRGFAIAIQEMGSDYSPGGNGEDSDSLLVWLAAGTGGYEDEGAVSEALGVAANWRDAHVFSQVFKQPLGFQAMLDPRVTVHHPAVFTSINSLFPPGGQNESTIPRASWPNENGGIRFLRPLGGYALVKGAWVPQDPHPLRFRFRVEEGKLYRMMATTLMRRPECPPPGNGVVYPPRGDWTARTFSQLAFGDPKGDQPRLNLRVTRWGADEIAVGTQADYFITVSNESQDPITSTTTLLTETLPLGVRIVSVHDVTDPNNERLVTNVATAPPVEQERGGNGPFHWVRWNLGELPRGAQRTLRVRITADPQAPDSFDKIAESFPAPPQKDVDESNNRSTRRMQVLRANVRASVSAPRLARPGEEFTVTARATNTTAQAPAKGVALRLRLPFGVTLVDAGGGDVEGDGTVVWRPRTQEHQLAGGQTLEGTVRVRVLREDEASALPASLDFVASVTTAQGYDTDPMDNEARAKTVVLIVPRPQADLRMRIHSEFDRAERVYRTDGAAFVWPIGETLYFMPNVGLTLRQPGLPYYQARARVVAWRFVGSGSLAPTGAQCRAREEPPAAETAHAELDRMSGCRYRYRDDATPDDMRRQGRLYWAAFAPDRVDEATYVITPLPPSPTTIRVQYAALVELVETGAYDLDEDGRGDSVLERRTFVENGTYSVTLVAPRDAR